MSSAAEKAAARRKAILSRGSDRLAKLTTSARGEDAPAYMPEASPTPPSVSNLREFVGEETTLPTPPSFSRNASSSRSSPQPAGGELPNPEQLLSALLGATKASDPDAMEQQRRLLSNLMGGAGAPPPPGQSRRSVSAPQASQNADPFAQLMALSQPPEGQEGMNMPPGLNMPNLFPLPTAAPTPKTLLQRVLPLIHVVAAWILLAYFIFWKEPVAFSDNTHGVISSENRWSRWAELGRRRPDEAWGVQFVPFFWAFTTLTIVLHSWRIFQGLDPVRPPMLLSMALQQMPPTISSIVLNGMKYMQIGSVFFDDVAALLVGLGFLIWLASWLSD